MSEEDEMESSSDIEVYAAADENIVMGLGQCGQQQNISVV